MMRITATHTTPMDTDSRIMMVSRFESENMIKQLRKEWYSNKRTGLPWTFFVFLKFPKTMNSLNTESILIGKPQQLFNKFNQILTFILPSAFEKQLNQCGLFIIVMCSIYPTKGTNCMFLKKVFFRGLMVNSVQVRTNYCCEGERWGRTENLPCNNSMLTCSQK